MTATLTPTVYVPDSWAIQREAGLWVIEQTLDDNGTPGLVVYNSANTSSDENEAISLRDALKFAWALVRQVVSVAARRGVRRVAKMRQGHAIERNSANGSEGGAKC